MTYDSLFELRTVRVSRIIQGKPISANDQVATTEYPTVATQDRRCVHVRAALGQQGKERRVARPHASQRERGHAHEHGGRPEGQRLQQRHVGSDGHEQGVGDHDGEEPDEQRRGRNGGELGRRPPERGHRLEKLVDGLRPTSYEWQLREPLAPLHHHHDHEHLEQQHQRDEPSPRPQPVAGGPRGRHGEQEPQIDRLLGDDAPGPRGERHHVRHGQRAQQIVRARRRDHGERPGREHDLERAPEGEPVPHGGDHELPPNGREQRAHHCGRERRPHPRGTRASPTRRSR